MSTTVTIATSEADARAAEAVAAHHAQLVGALALRTEAVAAALRSGGDVLAARDELLAWVRQELLPHAVAEESTLYAAAAARPEGRLLVEALLAEHGVITGLVDDLATGTDAVALAVTAGALREAFSMHRSKEEDQVIPLLLAAPDVSVADLLDGMHSLIGGHEHGEAAGAPEQASGGCGGHCTCGETDGPEWPELDARAVPHAIRHATIFGALDSVAPGRAMVLVAPHDPLPLLAQLEQRAPGEFTTEYLERGPEAWRILLSRRG